MKSKLTPSLNDIEIASKNLKCIVHKTPVLSSCIINSKLNSTLFFKCENFQKSGAFKFRGACNALLNLPGVAKSIPVTTHSSGNHAGALAKAAAQFGRNCIVVMPENAPKVKVGAVRHYGAEIEFCRPTLNAREETTEKVISKTGAELIHPYNNFYIIAGQGTCGLEFIEQVEDLDYVLAPVGGGGLISGTAIAIKGLNLGTRVLGAEPKGADDAYRSFKAGRLIPQTSPNSIADGLLTSLGNRTFSAISQCVDDIYTVSEGSIRKAMMLIWQFLKVIIEPSSAVALAVVMENPSDFEGKRVGIILSGGNVDFNSLPF